MSFFGWGGEAKKREPPGYYSYSPPVGLGPPPRADHLHPVWVSECGAVYPQSVHVCPITGKRHDSGDVRPLPIPVQKGLAYNGTKAVDAMEDDGPLSVAYGLQPEVVGIRPQIPAPNTGQYPYRYDARKMETWGQIKSYETITGYVQASLRPDADEATNEAEREKLNLDHRDDRIVYMVLSGWALMMWRSDEEYLKGKNGGRNAPRPLGWWDMRKAHDVVVELGESDSEEKCPHRIAVLTGEGITYFRVPHSGGQGPEADHIRNLQAHKEIAIEEGDVRQEQMLDDQLLQLRIKDVLIWYNGIRGLIREYNYQFIQSRDNPDFQRKRWPGAIGIAKCLLKGNPASMGEMAMALVFQAYDIDYNCILGVGEIMIMIQEVEAAIRHIQGYKEAQDRQCAMESSSSKFDGGLNEIFEKAMTFRNSCDRNGNGEVRKDEFIINGQALLAQALGFTWSGGGQLGQPEDACSVM